MAKRPLIRTAELDRMAKVATKFNVTVSVECGGVTFYVKPLEQVGGGPSTSPHSQGLAYDAPPEPVQPPFDHREAFAMEFLAEVGVGERVYSCTIRGFGQRTQEKLAARGYITVHSASEQRFTQQEISLNYTGLADWRAMKRHRNKYPRL